MMRAVSFQVPPEAPSNLTVATATTGLTLMWTDNSASETGFTLQRAADPGFTTSVSNIVVNPLSPDGNGQGITWGEPVPYNDTSATAGPYFYRVQAFKPDASYWTPSGTNITSAWSNTASSSAAPLAAVSPAALAFGNMALNTPSPAQTVTLSNTGNAALTYTTAIVGANLGDFAVTADPCLGNVAASAICAISVTFTPSAGGARSATLSIATNDTLHPTLTVLLTGTGGLPLLTITASNATMKYGSAVPAITASYNPPNPTLTTLPTCTTTAINKSPVGPYQSSCTGAAGNYTFNYVAGTVSVTPVPLTIWAPNASISENNPIPTSFTPSYVGFVAGDTSASLTTPPTCTTAATNPSPIGKYPITCSLAVDPNYTIKYVGGTLTITKGFLTVTAPSLSMPYGGPVPALTPTYSPANPVGLTTPATCTTGASVTSNVGTYPVTCTGAVDPNYTITYMPGTLTVSPVPLTITASSATMTYGGTVPAITPSFSGFVLGQNSGVLTAQPVCSTVAISSSPVSGSPYPSSCSGAAAANYTITYVPGKVTVNRALLTITASSATMTYGGTVPSITPSFSGFVLTDTSAVLTPQPTCSTTATSSSPVSGSPYPSSCTGAAAANYAISYVNGTVTVSKATTATTITLNTPNPSTLKQAVTMSFTVAPQFSGTPTGNVTVTASTSETCTGTVAAGTCSITFLTAGTRTLTATYAGDGNFLGSTSSGVSQTVNAPTVALSPASLGFLPTKVGTTSAPLTETVTNTGTGALINFTWSITGPNAGDFSIASTTCLSTGLAPGGSCRFSITFKPSVTGTRSATLTLSDNALNSPQNVGLSGKGN